MRLKRFTANTTAQALTLVKQELGDDAVILSSKTLTRPEGAQVEIMAAIDYNQGSDLPEQKQQENRPEPNKQSPPAPLTEEERVSQWRDSIISQLQTINPIINSGDGPVILSLVGPTGVGKTTTAAKMAAQYSLRQGLRVALISMDCYRIGATDQLLAYASIMKLPCEIAVRKTDLGRAVTKHRNCDLIIIDTAGKSPYDKEHIKELDEWFKTIPRLQSHLVVSATAKKEDIKETIRSYAPLRAAGIVLSKLDETRTYATLCQQVANARIPISCLTTGQRVPEDFAMATGPLLKKLFTKGWPALAELQNQGQH